MSQLFSSNLRINFTIAFNIFYYGDKVIGKEIIYPYFRFIAAFSKWKILSFKIIAISFFYRINLPKWRHFRQNFFSLKNDLILENNEYFVKGSVTVENLHISACAKIYFHDFRSRIIVSNGTVNIQGNSSCPINVSQLPPKLDTIFPRFSIYGDKIIYFYENV